MGTGRLVDVVVDESFSINAAVKGAECHIQVPRDYSEYSIYFIYVVVMSDTDVIIQMQDNCGYGKESEYLVYVQYLLYFFRECLIRFIIQDIQETIAGEGGISLVALWYFFVKK